MKSQVASERQFQPNSALKKELLPNNYFKKEKEKKCSAGRKQKHFQGGFFSETIRASTSKCPLWWSELSFQPCKQHRLRPHLLLFFLFFLFSFSFFLSLTNFKLYMLVICIISVTFIFLTSYRTLKGEALVLSCSKTLTLFFPEIVSARFFKLCTSITSPELHIFMPFSVTLVWFYGHSFGRKTKVRITFFRQVFLYWVCTSVIDVCKDSVMNIEVIFMSTDQTWQAYLASCVLLFLVLLLFLVVVCMCVVVVSLLVVFFILFIFLAHFQSQRKVSKYDEKNIQTLPAFSTPQPLLDQYIFIYHHVTVL